MKAFLTKALALCACVIMSSVVLAEAPTTNPAQYHPCQNIKTACQGAGYFKGGWKQGKGLWKNCMNPILAGRTIASVSVNANDVQACQTRRANKGKH